LGGKTPGDKARELVRYCVRHNRLVDLVEQGKQSRPDIEWDVAWSEQPTRGPGSSDPEVARARRSHYETLYRILKPLARYDLPEPLSIEVLGRVSADMRDWYFDAGGLYLSDASREPYFKLKEAIKIISQHPAYLSTQLVLEEDSETLLQAASRLRAALRDDLNLD